MSCCPYMADCNMYSVFRYDALLRIWQVKYCEGDFEACLRHQRVSAGEEVAPNLLPNGDLLDVPEVGR